MTNVVNAMLGTGDVSSGTFPTWVAPIQLQFRPAVVDPVTGYTALQQDSFMWVYSRGPVVIGVMLDADGYVSQICLAGEECGFARTAMWRPHQYVKLGDNYKRVLYRYGLPDATSALDAHTANPGGGLARDVVLRYGRSANVEFTLHNFTVTRIHIWR